MNEIKTYRSTLKLLRRGPSVLLDNSVLPGKNDPVNESPERREDGFNTRTAVMTILQHNALPVEAAVHRHDVAGEVALRYGGLDHLRQVTTVGVGHVL